MAHLEGMSPGLDHIYSPIARVFDWYGNVSSGSTFERWGKLQELTLQLIFETWWIRVGSCSHTNMSPCILYAECDVLQHTPREARRKRDKQDDPAGDFIDPKPCSPWRDPVRSRGGYKFPYVWLTVHRASWIHSLQSWKNENENTWERDKK